MNIKQIKMRAEDLLNGCKPQVIRILIVMLLIGTIPSLIGSGNFLLSFISFILSIVFIPFSHGQIVTALKVVRNNKGDLNDEDALVGFYRFKELFVTYFLTGLIMVAAIFIVLFISMLFFITIFGSVIAKYASLNISYSFDILSLTDFMRSLGVFGPAFVAGFLLCVLVIVVIMVILSLYLYAVPYLLEQYHLKGTEAIGESFSFIKGNVWNLFKLQLSFIGWILLFVILESVLIEVLSFIPILGIVIASLISGILAIYVYLPKYIVSMAIFFEEIAYYRYNSNQQGEMMNE